MRKAGIHIVSELSALTRAIYVYNALNNVLYHYVLPFQVVQFQDLKRALGQLLEKLDNANAHLPIEGVRTAVGLLCPSNSPHPLFPLVNILDVAVYW